VGFQGAFCFGVVSLTGGILVQEKVGDIAKQYLFSLPGLMGIAALKRGRQFGHGIRGRTRRKP
jgi:hypothetical protein